MLFAESSVVWITFGILFSIFDQSFAAYMRCYGTSFENHTEVPLKSADSLITDSNSYIDLQKPTVLFSFGFGHDPDNGKAVKTLISEFILLATFNLILLNWAKEAKGIGFGPLGYPSAVKNSKEVGTDLATTMVRLVELGLSKDIHYIGHSLGAQLLGHAGQESKKHNLTIPWLTALEPARPGFDPQTEYPPVNKTCAGFVDIIHTDPGGYGMNKSTGHIDIYPNYGFYLNGTRRQPGCSRSFSLEDIGANGNRCSHDRSWEYYNVSLVYRELFKVAQASTYYEWVQQNGSGSTTTYLGLKVDKQLQGNFYCSTSDTRPWGLQDAGLVP